MEWQTATVIDIIEVNPRTRRFFLQVPFVQIVDFKPGQFITLDLPIHEKKNKRWRSYSIASAPNGTNIIELIIVLLEGGLGTTYLFEQVNIGSELIFRGPQGVFTLEQPIEKDIYMICTGTGVAPFRSMLQHIASHNIPHQDIHLIFGCRTKADCLYYDEWKDVEKNISGFTYHPTLSREKTDNLGFYYGYVHQVYEKLLKTEKPPVSFYLCGWKNMVDEAIFKIEGLGYSRKDIHLELYG